MDKTQKEFLKNIDSKNTIIFVTKTPQKGDENYGDYIREIMIMAESIEIGSTINIKINEKKYIGKVLNLWKGGFKILLNGTREWKNGKNTKSFAYYSINEVIKIV